MTQNPFQESGGPSLPKAVRLLLILVALTATLSLLYAIQYYAGGPLRLQVVSEIPSLALSPDGTLIAAGDLDGVLHLWQVPADFSTRIPADFNLSQTPPWPSRTLSGHEGPILSVAFSPDGSTLISVDSSGQVKYWDAAAESADQPLKELDLGGEPLVDADLNVDRTTLAVLGEDGTVRIWDLGAEQEIQSIPTNGSAKWAVAISPDGDLVAADQGVNIQIWNAETGELVQELQPACEDPALTTVEACETAAKTWLGHVEDVTVLAFSPDGQLLASGSADTTITFWNVESGQAETDVEAHWATVTALVFGEQGKDVLSGGRDNKIRNLRLPGGKSTAIYEGHLNGVNGVAYGPLPEAILSASDDGTVRVWETANQKTIHMEWSRYGLQPTWGNVLAIWLIISGLLGLFCLWGLWRLRTWSHLLTLALYLLGGIVVLGLPLLETLSYPLPWAVKLQVAWPLIALLLWYIVLLIVLTREPVAMYYEAPQAAPLAVQLQVSRRTARTRFGIYSLAVWLALLVILYSVLRRFNLDIAFMGHYFEFIMQGAWITFRVSALSIALAVILALLGALGRLSRSPIANGVSGFYVSLIRGTPLLVQIYIWYLGLPRLGIVLQGELAGILALGVNYGAYMTEIFRAGIQAIGKGQYEAAEALGMSRAQTYRRIVLPQAFRIVIPPIGNEFIAMMKDSSLVSVMAIWELTYRAQKIGRQNFRNMETFIIAAAFYWILTVIFQFLQGKLEDYMARSERR